MIGSFPQFGFITQLETGFAGGGPGKLGGGPGKLGGGPGSGLGGSPHHILSSDIHVFLVANVLQILVSTSQQPFSQLQSAHVFV